MVTITGILFLLVYVSSLCESGEIQLSQSKMPSQLSQSKMPSICGIKRWGERGGYGSEMFVGRGEGRGESSEIILLAPNLFRFPG